MHTLHAVDLALIPEADSLWRKPKPALSETSHSTARLSPADLNLPADGFSSPLGFWFAGDSSWAGSPPRLTVQILESGDRGLASSAGPSQSRSSTTTFPAVRARPKAAARKTSDRNPNDVPLSIEIDATSARIGVDRATWSRAGQTVLFAVAQYWRLASIDHNLDELSHWARQDLQAKPSFAAILSRKRARDLRARRQELARLILDLPDFEGPLTNPRGYFHSKREVHRYRRLCTSLGLNRLRREIDERIEVVESIFDSLADSLNHAQSLLFHVSLELAIVALLLVDIGIYFWDAIF
jgi:hypothetical protein